MENIDFWENLNFGDDKCCVPFGHKSAMDFFKQFTLGKTCVVSDATYFALKKNNPRLRRDCIVLTNDSKLQIENATVCASNTSLFEALSKVNSDDIVVVGADDLTGKILNYCRMSTVVNYGESRGNRLSKLTSGSRWIKVGATQYGKKSTFDTCSLQNINVLPIWSLKFFDVLDEEYKQKNMEADAEKAKQDEFERMKKVLSNKKIKKVLDMKKSAEKTKTVFSQNTASCFMEHGTQEHAFSPTSSAACHNINYKGKIVLNGNSESTTEKNIYDKKKMNDMLSRVK